MDILCYPLTDQVLRMVLIGFVIIQVPVLYFRLIFARLIKFHYHHLSVNFSYNYFILFLFFLPGYHGEFQWDKYLLETNSIYAPQELFQVIKVDKADYQCMHYFYLNLGKNNKSIFCRNENRSS
jgi:hypothetical protein